MTICFAFFYDPYSPISSVVSSIVIHTTQLDILHSLAIMSLPNTKTNQTSLTSQNSFLSYNFWALTLYFLVYSSQPIHFELDWHP